MNVLLINPPLEHLIKVGIGLTVEKRGFFPSLGILYVAAYCSQYADHTIHVLDAPLEGIGYDILEQKIREKKPDIVGISTLTHSLIDSLKTARIVKKISSHIPVVFGGIHVTLFPFETMSFEEVDYAVTGEGEITFKELLENMGDNEKLKKVSDKSQAIGEFLAWLSSEKHFWIAKWYKHEDTVGDFSELIPIGISKTDLLAEYYGIDLKQLPGFKVGQWGRILKIK